MTRGDYRVTVRRGDIAEAMKIYPYVVTKEVMRNGDADIADWLATMGDNVLVISKIRIGPPQNFGPMIVSYGFKREDDATAFVLRFGK